MGRKDGKKSTPAQLEHQKNYVENIFKHVDRNNTVQMPISSIIQVLRNEGLSHVQISILLGCDASLLGDYSVTGMPGAKVVASVLRRITYKGQHVVVCGSADFIIDQYAKFYVQFAHGDGKLHDVGLDGSEWTYYEAR